METRIDRIKTLLTMSASKLVSGKEAQIFAQLYMETHSRKSPRMNPLQEALNDINTWRKFQTEKLKGNTFEGIPESVVDKAGMTLYDFKSLPPSLKIKEIQDTLAVKARENGIAAAGMFNTGGIVTLNMWADGLAKKDLIGLAMFNGGTECCVPPNGKKGAFGTNPLAWAVPTLDLPMQIDMATTQIAYFDIKQAKESNTPLPEGAAVDSQGFPTTDAGKALDSEGIANLLPVGGGIKGYGIMMLIEILTGTLVRSLLSTEQSRGWNPEEYGCFIIAIDPASFTDPDQFKQRITQMGEITRDLEPAEGKGPVPVPGDRGHAKFRNALKEGMITVDSDIISQLEELANGEE